MTERVEALAAASVFSFAGAFWHQPWSRSRGTTARHATGYNLFATR